MYHIDSFVNIEKSLFPWDKAHLIIVCSFLNVLLDLVCYYFVEGFYTFVHQ